jgi:hypothetical protein
VVVLGAGQKPAEPTVPEIRAIDYCTWYSGVVVLLGFVVGRLHSFYKCGVQRRDRVVVAKEVWSNICVGAGCYKGAVVCWWLVRCVLVLGATVQHSGCGGLLVACEVCVGAGCYCTA